MSSSSRYSVFEEGGTPRAVRARRREVEGMIVEVGVSVKREKASRISDSVEAEMLFSLAILEGRGFFSGGLGAGAVGRRFGGYGAGR